MDQEPLVSIIIDNYNYGRFLSDAIESALHQTYRPLEVIVVDDGSTDDSRDIIRRYDDRIISILKDNGGQASAFNAGFVRSRGDIIIFLDSDDILFPETAQRVVGAFQANEMLAKVEYRMEVIDTQGHPTGILKPLPYLPLLAGDLQRHTLTFPFDMVRMATSGNAFPAQYLRQIFPVPEHDFRRVGADWYLCYVAPLFGSVAFLDDVGAYYRIHGGNKFESANPTLRLDHIRQVVTCVNITRPYIEKYADQLHLPRHPGEILSVSDVANRMISFKLDPHKHPLPSDRLGKLVLMGFRAALRRFDIVWPMKCMFLGWFVAMALAPKPLAYWLAELFSFPEKRGDINRLLGSWHMFSRKRSSIVDTPLVEGNNELSVNSERHE